VQHRNWALRRNPGYSDLVARGGSVEVASEMIQHIDDWGVDVLPAGTRLPDTLGCIMAPVLHDLLDHWTKKYDYVLLDSAPAFVADASILAQHADMVLLVVRPGTVEAGNLRQALVFNGVTRSSSDYYYYGYNADYTYGETNDEPSEQDSYPKAG
jgi:Mrp family chromosome partitioning ATPase